MERFWPLGYRTFGEIVRLGIKKQYYNEGMSRLKVPFISFIILICSVSLASAATGTIVAPHQYSWNDNGGYVNWLANGGNVTVSDTALTGYVWSAGFGWINLAPANGGVANSNGALSGTAWSTNAGYIDFTGVTIDSNGQFHGHTAAQSTFGTMTFDCTNCDVNTSWHSSASNSGGGGVVTGDSGNGQIVGSAPSAPGANGVIPENEAVLSLQAQLQSLSAQLAALRAGTSTAADSSKTAFNRNLQLGDISPDVRRLQAYLNSRGFSIAQSGTGSPGNETSYFGTATFRALKKFQAAHGLLSTGFFGPLTRAYINLRQ